MQQLITLTAEYENGVLKPEGGHIPNLVEGDRVEVVLVRIAPIDADAPEEVARRERILKAFEEATQQLASLPPDPGDDEYDVLEAMNATRVRQGERPLIPPSEAR
jgi:predicted DNA-binding antitoxin AbrB/MazE fold protein